MANEKTHFAQTKKSNGGLRRVWNAFFYSCSGLALAFRYEHAFKQEIFVCVPAAILVLVSPISWICKTVLLAPIPLILVVELLNSAIEAVVDDISLDYRDLAKRAKDFAAAAVFITILSSAILWCVVIFYCVKSGQLDAWLPAN